MKLRPAGFAAISLALVLLVSGCSETPVLESSATPSVAPSNEPVASPTAQPAGPAPMQCEDLLMEETLAEFEPQGFILVENFESALRAERAVQTAFFDFGGLACRWEVPNSDNWAEFGYSEISAANATNLQAELDSVGYERTEENSGVFYALTASNDTLGHEDWYLFEDGSWYHSAHRGGIDEVKAQVGEFKAAQ